MDFDLGTLTIVGWLVFFFTLVIIGAGTYFMVSTAAPAVGDAAHTNDGRKVMAGISLGAGVAFFVACKFFLKKIGLPMFKD